VEYLLTRYPNAVEFDYRKFYDSLDTTAITHLLDKHHFPRELTLELLDPNYTEEGVAKHLDRGILQGNPISPLISILALETLGLYQSPDYEYVGYADDGILFTNGEPAKAILTLTTNASPLGLELKPSATNVIQYHGLPREFTFLGLKRSPDGVLEIKSKSGRYSGTQVTLETLAEVYKKAQAATPPQAPQLSKLMVLVDPSITPRGTQEHYHETCALLERLRRMRPRIP